MGGWVRISAMTRVGLAAALPLLLGGAVGACAKLDLPPEPAPGCTSTIALDGTGTASTMTLDPIDLGSGDVCMHLDATKNVQQAHLQITVGEQSEGATTPFHTTLVDENGASLQTGWDVAIDTHAFHDLEWSLEAGEVRDVTLHVSRTGPVVKTPIHVALYEPLED